MRALKAIVISVGLATAAAAAGLGVALATHDPNAWVEDFTALRRHMAQHYANLDWAAHHRGSDLAKLSRDTESALRSARIDRQAQSALQHFVDVFDDPHLKLVKGVDPPASRSPSQTPETCAERGFHVRKRDFIFPFEKAPRWLPAGGKWFPAGTFDDVAVLRVASFGEDGYREACDEVGPAGVRARLNDELRKTIGELRSRRPRVLVVDITGNGGGTEWVNEVTRLLTAKTLHRPRAKIMEPDCDRFAVWEGAEVCPGLKGEGESTLSGEGAWDGPLAVLVDGATASASEDMVVWLRESQAAIILGEPTFGAGCGYVKGGAPARLTRIGWTVLMPNCARFTSDGINEIEGIAPDTKIPIRSGPAGERLDLLRRARPVEG